MGIIILIAENNTLFREGLRKVLKDELDSVRFLEAQNGNEIFDNLKKNKISLILVNISLPGKNPLEIIKDIKRFHPAVNILIYGMQPEDNYTLRVLKLGASAYLSNKSTSRELLKAIKLVFSNSNYISPDLTEKLAKLLVFNQEKFPHEDLSDREFEVLRYIAVGKSPSAIAKELHLGIPTIHTYRARIMEKMKMKTNAELIYYSIKNGIIT